jgi:segregation and condensation protein A
MEYKIVVDVYEGPMDVLLNLIEKAEVDIYDIPINLITEQYMNYIYEMEGLNLEIASEFLIMASTLLEIKSKMLLPKEVINDEGNEIEVDPRDELVRRLIEYKMFKEAAEKLRFSEDTELMAYYKPREDLDKYTDFEENFEAMDLNQLVKSLYNIMVKKGHKDISISEINREEYTLEYCIEEIEDKLENAGELKFTDLLSNTCSKEEIITYFLSILELIRLKSIYILQDKMFSDIIISKRMDDMNG